MILLLVANFEQINNQSESANMEFTARENGNNISLVLSGPQSNL